MLNVRLPTVVRESAFVHKRRIEEDFHQKYFRTKFVQTTSTRFIIPSNPFVLKLTFVRTIGFVREFQVS